MAELDIPLQAIPHRKPWAPGSVVRGATLLARIATGGMAEIWLARQAGLQGFEKLVVIKRMTDALCEDPEFVEMFLDEARIAAQLNHSGIVQIYDLGEREGAYFITMEYLAGENLQVVLREGAKKEQRLSNALAARIIASVASALAYAHALKGRDGRPLEIVHRDVSPQNILLTYDGQVKILDFGIAKAAHRASVTQQGKLKGKFAYMSPEHARGEVVTHLSDQFELAIVLYEAVTRQRLYVSNDAAEAVIAATTANIVPARERNPSVPVELSDIIQKALSPQPENRFTDCAELARALEYWLKLQTGVPGAADLATYMSGLFGERIQARTQLLERARLDELTPASRDELPAAARNKTSLSQEVLVPPSPWPMRGLFAALAVGAAVTAFVFLRTSGPETLLTIETEPAGATVKIDGKVAGRSPVVLHAPALGAHAVIAELEGRETVSRSLNVAAEGEHQTVVLTLAATPAPAPAPQVVAAPAPAAVAVPPPAEAPAAPVAKPAPNEPKAAAKGRLTLDTDPWTMVSVGNRKLGETPLVDVPLPAGHHVLKLENEAKGISSSVMVDIKPGAPTVMKLKL
jgi:serine/threonine-protein kinase